MNKHTVPEALRPQQRPHLDIHDVELEPHLEYADAQHLSTPPPPPRYETVGGFRMERHPILDGEHAPRNLRRHLFTAFHRNTM